MRSSGRVVPPLAARRSPTDEFFIKGHHRERGQFVAFLFGIFRHVSEAAFFVPSPFCLLRSAVWGLYLRQEGRRPGLGAKNPPFGRSPGLLTVFTGIRTEISGPIPVKFSWLSVCFFSQKGSFGRFLRIFCCRMVRLKTFSAFFSINCVTIERLK